MEDMFEDRQAAAKQLAAELEEFKDQDVVVLALPRGGVVLAAVIAKKLNAPLGLILVRKIRHPNSPEYAIGALADQGQPIFNQLEAEALDGKWLEQEVSAQKKLIAQRREEYYPPGFKQPVVKGKTAILVDDGIATGLTMESAVKAVKEQRPTGIVVAVPVAPADSLSQLKRIADRVIVLEPPENFRGAVGSHYRQFGQVDDEQVIRLLMRN